MKNDLSELLNENRFYRREFQAPHNLYSDEVRILEAVKEGDVSRVKELCEEPVFGIPGRLSVNPLRNAQNLLITRATTVSRAAIEGGLPNEEAYTYSDAYIIQSENCRTVEEVNVLSKQMVIDFASYVADRKKRTYSPVILKAMDLISQNLHYPLSLQTLSEVLNVSVCYLSRLFKKETGMSFVTYVQREKVRAAQNMLLFSDSSYMEIATCLNFRSQSYFIAIFKKHAGMTPAQYRKTMQKI